MPTPLDGYTSYKGLPPLAGLCSLEEAARPGLSVEECVRRLKRFHYAFKRLHQILTARITAEPIYELKTAFAHHAHLCAEHATALRTRVGELREPPLGLDDVPHPALEAFFDELLAAPTTEELVSGHGAAMFALWNAISQYEADTNPLTDAPSRRRLRFARIEVDDMMNWGSEALNCVAEPDREPERLRWVALLGDLLRRAGGLDGTATTPASRTRSSVATPQPPTSTTRSRSGTSGSPTRGTRG